MTPSIKCLASGFALSLLSSFAVNADGVSTIYSTEGLFIDEIEILGDVTLPSGEVIAALVMRDQNLKFFVDPDAVYVTMYDENPILTQQTPFYGYWISTQPVESANWPRCSYEVTDENGARYGSHGTLVWTNSGIAENGYELAFRIDLGRCSDKQEAWGYSEAGLKTAGLDIIYNGDVPDQEVYTITEASGLKFSVEVWGNSANLISVDLHKIIVPATDDPALNEIFIEEELIEMYADCGVSSARRGEGTWSWGNGGFFVDFETVSYSFPRMDAPVENGGACQIQ